MTTIYGLTEVYFILHWSQYSLSVVGRLAQLASHRGNHHPCFVLSSSAIGNFSHWYYLSSLSVIFDKRPTARTSSWHSTEVAIDVPWAAHPPLTSHAIRLPWLVRDSRATEYKGFTNQWLLSLVIVYRRMYEFLWTTKTQDFFSGTSNENCFDWIQVPRLGYRFELEFGFGFAPLSSTDVMD